MSFYGESYIHIPYNEDLSATNLELRFKATRPYGVLVLVLGSYDYFLLQLHQGTIQLKVIDRNVFITDVFKILWVILISNLCLNQPVQSKQNKMYSCHVYGLLYVYLAMLSLWFDICMVCYGICMVCYDICMVCYMYSLICYMYGLLYVWFAICIV